jgi:hypothetical protein
MNLVEVATWIHDGYKSYNSNVKVIKLDQTKRDYVTRYVLDKGRGQLNPQTIIMLVEMETSIPDENGCIIC